MEATYDDIAGLEFEEFRFWILTAKPLAVDECTTGTPDVFDVNLESEVILVYPSKKRIETSWRLPFRLVPILQHVFR